MTDSIIYRYRLWEPTGPPPATGTPAGPLSSELKFTEHADDEETAMAALAKAVCGHMPGSHGDLWRIRAEETEARLNLWGLPLHQLRTTNNGEQVWVNAQVTDRDSAVEIPLNPEPADNHTRNELLRRVIAGLKELK